MSVKLLTEHYLEFLSLKGGCTGSSESTLVKMPHCWKSHIAAHIHVCNSVFFCTFSEVKSKYLLNFFLMMLLCYPYLFFK